MRFLSIREALISAALVACVTCASGQDVYSVRGPWLDDQARAFSLESLRGSYTVITMAYGACRRVCSSSLKTIHDLAALAAQQHVPLHVLVVGLDPTQDKPSDWAELRAERKLWFRDLEFLSGTETSTRVLAQSIGVKYWRYGEHTMHDFRLVLVSPAGKVVRAMDRFDQNVADLLP